MAWRAMKPETIERRAAERADEQVRSEAARLAKYREIVARHEAEGDHEGAQLYREIFGLETASA